MLPSRSGVHQLTECLAVPCRRYLTADPSRRKLAIAIGAPCNVPGMGTGGVNDCSSELPDNNYPLLATIAEFDLDGSNLEVVARGVRNSVGITFHPDTNEMWFTENGRDQWGSSGSTATPVSKMHCRTHPADGLLPSVGSECVSPDS